MKGKKVQQVQWSNGRWSIGDLGAFIPDSSISNGPLGVTGWNATAVRLYYFIDGKITELAYESSYTAWASKTMAADDYD